MRKRLTSALIVGLAAACSADTPDAPRVAFQEIPSPAGEGSGEPFLSSFGDIVYMSWLEPAASGGHDLRFSRLESEGWVAPLEVATSEGFFVNWADFPSITPAPDGTLWAHWLERGDAGGYDYGVRVAHSIDGGVTWSVALTPHEDGTPTEHGFVSVFPSGDGIGVAWLDGRRYAAGPDGMPPTQEMTLRFRRVGTAGMTDPETLLDGRVCDCCQTDAALTSAGPVLVYRDRSAEEIRDIYATRWDGSAWTEGAPVHADGWEIGGCPVNGPAVAARGDRVVVAWFTAAGDVPRVRVAFSEDAGATFGPAVEVDDGSPAGRVDVLMSENGSALVSWIERTGGEGAEVRLREVTPQGGAGESVTITTASAERASGFPRMVETAGGRLIVAWTDVSGGTTRVRVTAVDREGA